MVRLDEDGAMIRRDQLSDGTECFAAEDPALPGCVSYAGTPEEALADLPHARAVYLRAIRRAGPRRA
jgi:predicted RNase H-like HicB family nuclease